MHPLRALPRAVRGHPHAAHPLLRLYRRGGGRAHLHLCQLFELFHQHGKTFHPLDELYGGDHLHGAVPFDRLPRRLYPGAQQAAQKIRAADAVHPAHVDQLRSAHHGAARAFGSHRPVGDGKLPQYHHRHGVRLSALHDPAPVYDAGKAGQQLPRGGIRPGRGAVHRVRQGDLPPVHAGRHFRHHHGIHALHDQLCGLGHAEQLQHHHFGQAHRPVLHHL